MDLKKKLVLAYTIFLIFFPSCCYADNTNYSTPSLNSRSAIIIEKSTGTILFGKNENEKRKMASTTKIMTAIVVLENVNDLSEIATVSKNAASIGGSRLGLSVNATITVNDLLYGLLLCSGNDAAICLAEYVGGSVELFADLMNKKALELNLINTHFVTPHGLDNDEHYTTAYELALITKYALENKTFSKIVSTKNYSVLINNSPKNINNTNELLGYLDGVYGVKTGFTNGANRCLVTSCKRGDLDIICVVLGADTKKMRTQDSIKLIEYAFYNFEMIDIQSIIQEKFEEWKYTNSYQFIVNKGLSNSVECYIDTFQYSKYPMNKFSLEDLSGEISCKYYLEAPLLSNSKLGTFSLYAGDFQICELGIYSSNSILKKSPFFYLNSFLKNYSVYLENIL